VKTKGKSIFIVAFLILGIFIILAQSVTFGQQTGGLPTIRFTGVVYPADGKDIRGGLKNLRIFIEKKEWIFKVTKAENVYNADRSGLQITGNMSDRLHLQEGIKGILAPFQKPGILGKTITIQGLANFPSELIELYQLTVGEEGNLPSPGSRQVK
jgi:hypothetical protein